MNSALKLVLALALLAGLAGVAAILWLWPARGTLALEPERPAEKALESPGSAALDSEQALAAEAPGPLRSSVASEAKSAPAAQAEAEAEIVARIVDENLRPIANAWLRLDEQGFVRIKPGSAPKPPRPPLEARSGGDGGVTLHWKGPIQGYPARFVAGADGYGWVFPRGILKAGETLHLGDLTLHPGGSVQGRVVDQEQRPVAGAQVVVADEHEVWGSNDLEQLRNRGPSNGSGAPQSQSTEDGSFVVEGVVAGMTRAWARSESSRWAVSEPLEVSPGVELRDVVLVIAAEDDADADLRDIEGLVVGPDEKPIPRARLRVRQEREHSSSTSGSGAGEDGRFQVRPRERGAKITIEFSDPSERYTAVRLEDVKPGTKNLVVRLEEPKTVSISVRDERGPVENFRVRWGLDEWNTRANVDKDEPHADGRALLRVPAQSAFWYEVQAPGHVPQKLGPLEGRALSAELAVTLVSIPGIRGRVLAGGKPVGGAKLALFEQPANSEIEMNGFTTLFETDSKTSTKSDSEGRFTLELQHDGSFAIFTDAEGYARAQWGPSALEAQKGLQDLVLELDAGGTLEGKVLMPPGRSPAGVIVGINRGDARPITKVVGPEGTFRFERLTAGAWEIQRCEEMFHGATSTSISSGDDIHARDIRHDLTIAVAQTTRMDLDLRDSEPCVLEIELSNNSQPARAWSIVAWPKDKHTFSGNAPSASTDSNGRARLSIEAAGDCALTISPPAETGSAYKFQAVVTLVRGPNPWSQNIATGRVEGAIAGWQPDLGMQWRFGENGQPSFDQNLLVPDASGHFSVPFLPAGKLDVLRQLPSGQGWEKVQSFELAAGQTKTLQLP